ncbi:MAG: DNA/RNA helicase domain-containing protein [Bacilli bacterium]|nr:DNA/RNA helicase domain-containing protein [Bacilli bacterium]
MPSEFETIIEQFSFDKNGINKLRSDSKHYEDWPVVYILNGDKEAYVGETQSAYDRMNQHYINKDTTRKNLTRINIVQSDSFNKSAILDIENLLITHMHADGKFVLQNANGGQSKLHNYYQRSKYQDVFSDIWKKLMILNLVDHSLFEVENTDIFKFSPFKQLTKEQYQIVEELLKEYINAMQTEERKDIIINGGAGTGKTLIAIYFLNLIANILNNNFDTSNLEDNEDNESFLNKSELIREIKKSSNVKIGFVIAVPSFKETVKKVFNSIKELRKIKVISPSEASRGEYDVLIVDEAHRLKRRNRLTNYGTHDNINRSLGLPKEATELDWLKLKTKKLLILFYDKNQSVKESDVKKEDFEKISSNTNTTKFYLTSQLRVKGGNEYIDFVHHLFSDSPINYEIKNGYDVKVFDDCFEMMQAIKQKNVEYKGLCRMLSGLSFYWRKKARDKRTTQYKQDYDFEIDGHHYCWNEDFNASDFITNDKYIDNIGCIYTSQGHDLNYAGVILGKDISYNPQTKEIEYHLEEYIDTNSKSSDDQETIKNIINAYLVLLTRGVYGTYIYAVDKNLREYIKELIKK